MPAAQFQPMVFVDLETTGSTGTVDRITEIGIVEIDEEGGVHEWSSLVNPQTSIPSFIQSLTGISNEMVADAPTFAELAEEVLSRLHGRLFVAHNARFDYGFLKNEFKRLDLDFKAPVLCTVKLSRKLFPQYGKHNLDALVERHQLHMPARHRALADADVLRQFWQVLLAQMPADQLDAAVGELTGRSSWPAQLDPAVLADLPERHGVYLFFGDNDLPLYIGKANNIRQRVLSHFNADHRASKEMSLSQQVRRVTWIETAGEMGALLKEAQLIKQWQPIHNRRLRRNEDLCTWQLVPPSAAAEGGLKTELTWARDLDWGQPHQVYGLFNSQKDAVKTLREIAEGAQLCLVTLGLDKVPPGRPCFGYQLHQCSGVCIGEETQAAHAQRLRNVMADWQVQVWPHEGPVKVSEGPSWHVLDAWCYLGTAQTPSEVQALLAKPRPSFDKDTYKILVSWLPKLKVEALSRSAQ
ncbi:MAG TPA: exonuclease domain-containing protein [Aquabacterium sp.]|uniref:3'-5' exonuclease family protein n=1 Tax=Aquabacterium sp. TaxID=1872578 RepID=UPI002E2F2449|nr:exonuclease domain-containing protein [Aquabacterium sp.]HEX5356198.1 exonuclease domain-containing protein [Aquabacterium sp.]